MRKNITNESPPLAVGVRVFRPPLIRRGKAGAFLSRCFPVTTILACVTLTSCSPDLANLFASLGGGRPGGRGDVQVLFINNTPHRAVFTYGTYDQTDPDFEPEFFQFVLDGARVLDGDASSNIRGVTCGRIFSLGSATLLDLIETNLPDEDRDADAFVEGIDFYQVAEEGDEDPDGEDDAEELPADPVLIGRAPAFEALLGVDFPCGALLIFYLEIDDAGPDDFRVDFQLIPAESTR